MAVFERSLMSADDLIQLPRFDAVGAVTLGERLMEAAGAEADLPPPVRKAKESLEGELANLRAAAAARLASVSAGDPAVVADADRTLDGCWTALYDWLTGFSKLPDGLHEAREARGLLTDLYPDGLSFILLPYELEWHQSDLRLGRLAAEPLGERVRALGGAVFLDALSRAHNAYGKLLGLPRPIGAPDSGTPSVGEALEGFVSALRVYALKVTAQVEIEDPETADLSNRLLSPLLHWPA
jgi:hypothetical protein